MFFFQLQLKVTRKKLQQNEENLRARLQPHLTVLLKRLLFGSLHVPGQGPIFMETHFSYAADSFSFHVSLKRISSITSILNKTPQVTYLIYNAVFTVILLYTTKIITKLSRTYQQHIRFIY